jgi:hypothetical protein
LLDIATNAATLNIAKARIVNLSLSANCRRPAYGGNEATG